MTHPDSNLVEAATRTLEKPLASERLRSLLGHYMSVAQLVGDLNQSSAYRAWATEQSEKVHTELFWEWMKEA